MRPRPLPHTTPPARSPLGPAPATVGADSLALPTVLAWQIAYLLAGGGVLLLQAEAGPSFWYPPVALGVLLLCRYGWRAAPIVLIGDFILSAVQHGSATAGAVIGANTVLEAGLATALLARARVDLRLPDVNTLVRLLLLGAVVPTFIGATNGSLWLLALGANTQAAALGVWLTWWLGDAVTTICLLPALLLWLLPPARRPGATRPPEVRSICSPEGALRLAATAALCVIAFGWAGTNQEHLAHSLQYLCLLPPIWAAFRLGVRATSLAVALTSSLAVLITLLAGSPAGLSNIQLTPVVLDIQLFMLAVTVGSMILALALKGERAARATSQRDAEALRDSEARQRLVLQEMPVLLDAFDADGICVLWNGEAERITGYSAGEIVGNPRAWELLYPDPDYRERMLGLWASRGNDYRGWEWELTRKDGEKRTIAWSNISARVAIPGWVAWGVGVDVSERRQAEAALRASEEQFRQLAEALRRRNRELNLLNRVIAASAASAAPQAILSTVCQELALAFEAPRAYAALPLLAGAPARLIAAFPGEGEPAPAEAEIDGLLEQLRARRGPVLCEGAVGQRLALPLVLGELVSGVVCLWAADRPWADDEVQLAESVTRQAAGALARAQLTQAHQLLSVAQEQAGESTVITDASGAILAVNPAFERMSGYSQAEALGKNPRILKSGLQDQAFYGELWATIRRGEVWRGRLVNRRKDGAHYTEDATIAPIRGADGAITHYVAVKRDVTRELELEAQFRQAQKMEAVGRLAGGIAHDFNNLLSVINGYSEFLLEAHPDRGDPVRHDVETIRQAGERAAGLTRQLLAFSRRQTLQPQVVSVNEVLAEVERLLRRLIGEDIAIVLRTAPDLWPVYVDRGQLEQVVMNLAVNARDAMPTGGRLTFTTRNVREAAGPAVAGDAVRIEVDDTGVGMSAETLERLFEPFFTTKEMGRGTGLGLATAHGIVTQSGGSIQAQSAHGRGTRFTIDLPRHLEPAAAGAGAIAQPPPLGGAGTILLVEDEPAIRAIAARVLRRQGYSVLEAADAEEAFARSAGVPIDLLLSDIVLQGMRGPALADKLRRGAPGLRVLLMSGYPDHAPLDAHGRETVLLKPFTPTQLAAAVRAALEGERSC